MEFVTESHRFGREMARLPEYRIEFEEVENIIRSISDEEIIEMHNSRYAKQKSISMALNQIFRDKFTESGWIKEARIFQLDEKHPEYDNKCWRLDFAKNDF